MRQHVVLAPDDGSLGPLLRMSDDRLAPGEGYGRHEHRAVDVVALVVSGSLTHRWDDGAELAPGNVGVLRAGSGLDHDETAGPDGARVLQAYLRSAAPSAAPAHEVVPAGGWVDLQRADARLWVGPGEGAAAPAGLRLVVTGEGVSVGGSDPIPPAALVVVWQLDTGRPEWALG